MDFVRKNMGLIGYGCLCLAIGVFIVLKTVKETAGVGELETSVQNQIAFFDDVKTQNYSLTDGNLQIARENKEKAEDEFIEFRTWLARQYAVVPRSRPTTAVECIHELKSGIKEMQKTLNPNQTASMDHRGGWDEDRDSAEGPVSGVVIESECWYFSFERLAQSSILPGAEHIPVIMKHLEIVREIVRLVKEAEPSSIMSIERPMMLASRTEEYYTITPFVVTVRGNLNEIQNFANSMAVDANFLFFLRNMSLESQDQAPNGMVPGVEEYKRAKELQRQAELMRESIEGTAPRGPRGPRPGGRGFRRGGMDQYEDYDIEGYGDGEVPEMVVPNIGVEREGRGRSSRDERQYAMLQLTKRNVVPFMAGFDRMGRTVTARLHYDVLEFREPGTETETETETGFGM